MHIFNMELQLEGNLKRYNYEFFFFAKLSEQIAWKQNSGLQEVNA